MLTRPVRSLAVPIIGLVMMTLVGCGGPSSSKSASEQPDREPAVTAPTTPLEVVTPKPTSEPTDAFPITIKHELGSTVIPGAPQRVLALSSRYRDAAYALGVTPLPARVNADKGYTDPRPWAPFAAKWTTSTVLFGNKGLDYQAIMALKPDLILHGLGAVLQSEYEALSRIAPTLVKAEGTAPGAWQTVTRATGAALGRSARAEAVVKEMEGRLAKVASENPRFKGRSVAVASYSGPTDSIYVLDPRGVDMQFFSALGFKPASLPTRIDPARFGDLDVDFLLWDLATEKEERAKIEADPRLSTLKAVKDKRAVYMDGDLASAFATPSVLSLQYALDKITPLLQAVPG